MTVHMRAPSGMGYFALCGAAMPVGETTYKWSDKWSEVDCQKCADKVLTDKPQPEPAGYYDAGRVQTADMLERKLTAKQYRGFLLGNILERALRLKDRGDQAGDAEALWDYAAWLAEAFDD